MTSRHPSTALLRAYATGAAPFGASLAVASHLTYCPSCRSQVAEAEAVAGALLTNDEARADAPEFASLEALLDINESEVAIAAPPAAPARDAGPLPRPVADAIGCSFDDIPWRFRLPGVYEYEFAAEDGETISLLKVRPGSRIPQHTHTAEELTVVFDGELIDGDNRFGVGDVSVADGEVDHDPRAGEGRDCICLAVLSGGLHFTGPFSRALNLFT